MKQLSIKYFLLNMLTCNWTGRCETTFTQTFLITHADIQLHRMLWNTFQTPVKNQHG